MALEIKLSQKLSQTLVMTPQLQQAIKLLQLGRQEYLEVLEKELLENPVLEEVSTDEDLDSRAEASSPETEQVLSDYFEQASVLSERDLLQPSTFGEYEDDSSSAGGETVLEDRRRQVFEESEMFGQQSDFGYARRTGIDGEWERPSIEATISSPEGLTSHLLWQLRALELSPREQEIVVLILGNLDRNGYLCADLEELARMGEALVEEVGHVLSIVQTLDPPGIAARDLRECLLIQLDQLGQSGTLIWRIVRDHLSDLEMKRYDLIAKNEGVAVENVYEAVKEIQKLEPRPGRPFVDEAPVYITPDVYVRKVGDSYVIALNDSGMPRIRVSREYQEMIFNGRGKSSSEKEYLQDRIRSASWLIKSIHQRQQTIYRVTESIMKLQHDFLEHGVQALKPLVLRDVADDVGMHESTVSRVTTNKYVQTPQGVFELKFFFSSGLRSGEGEVSSESVKNRIRELISAEDPKKPLSDQALVSMLRAEGVDIARRTVAKYREMMNILSSSRRKKVF